MNTLFECATRKEEWLTPPWIMKSLGVFDLDPCAPVNRPWDTAARHYTIDDDGLRSRWSGRVWCNPPYGKQLIHWLRRCAEHRNCIVLVYARTDSEAFQKYVFPYASAMLFIGNQIHYFDTQGIKSASPWSPSVLVAYNRNNAIALKDSGIDGAFIMIDRGAADTEEQSTRYKMHDEVEWSSHAGVNTKEKRGRVVKVIPAGMRLPFAEEFSESHERKFDGGFPRYHESYLVEVTSRTGRAKPRLYWPRVSGLRKCKVGSVITSIQEDGGV